MSGRIVILAALLSALAANPGAAAADESVSIFDAAEISWDRATPDPATRNGLVVLDGGQMLEREASLPPAPVNQRDARRIVAVVEIEPILIEDEGKVRPGDPWTRLGAFSILTVDPKTGQQTEVELVRFITGFGGPGVFEQDVTALAPLLHGKQLFRGRITTWRSPGWRISAQLRYEVGGAGFRRPVIAQPLFHNPMVTAREPVLKAEFTMPPASAGQRLETPRIRVLSTGHATDGTGGDEFITRTHVLRVDGRVVAMWRPWSEHGGALRDQNPTSGRREIDGRELWSSDLDRSGWAPGMAVEPTIIPLPELAAPGSHTIELEIRGIRPKDESGQGYWRISAVLVADEPWPVEKDAAAAQGR